MLPGNRPALTNDETISPVKIELLRSPTKNENRSRAAATEGVTQTFANHPHGLRAKHDARRKTIHHFGEAFTPPNVAARTVATSPRPETGQVLSTSSPLKDSPTYNRRSKRFTSGNELEMEHYLIGVGKKPERLSAIGSPDSNPSLPPRKRPGHADREESKIKTSKIAFDTSENRKSIIRRPENVDGSTLGMSCLSEFDIGADENNNEGFSRTVQSLNPLSSPLKSQNLISKGEDLVAPMNEKPLFSMQYLAKVQEAHAAQVLGMESSIAKKNLEIIDLREKLSEIQSLAIQREQRILELDNRFSSVSEEKEMLEQQLCDTHSQYLSCVKELEQKKTSLSLEGQKLIQADLRLEACERSFADKEISLRETISNMKSQLDSASTKLEAINSERIDALASEKEAEAVCSNLREELATIHSRNATLVAEISRVRDENRSLEERTGDLSSQILDKEGALADLNEKLDALVRETENLHGDMAILETEQRSKEKSLIEQDQKLQTYVVATKRLESDVQSGETKLKLCEDKLALQIVEHQRILLENSLLLSELKALRSQSEEKDEIISGDTRKLTELVEEVNDLKQRLSDLRSRSTKGSTIIHKEADPLQQIAELQRQVASAQQKTDERIQEVAEELYHQYSKKHEVKVNQLKSKYETKIDQKNEEIERMTRHVHTLESLLKMEAKEKNYLLNVLERGKE